MLFSPMVPSKMPRLSTMLSSQQWKVGVGLFPRRQRETETQLQGLGGSRGWTACWATGEPSSTTMSMGLPGRRWPASGAAAMARGVGSALELYMRRRRWHSVGNCLLAQISRIGVVERGPLASKGAGGHSAGGVSCRPSPAAQPRADAHLSPGGAFWGLEPLGACLKLRTRNPLAGLRPVCSRCGPAQVPRPQPRGAACRRRRGGEGLARESTGRIVAGRQPPTPLAGSRTAGEGPRRRGARQERLESFRPQPL
jgi:hypothetical protein